MLHFFVPQSAVGLFLGREMALQEKIKDTDASLDTRS